MSQYLLSVHTGGDSPGRATTDEEARRGFEGIAKLESEMMAASALVFSGRLTDASSASVVHASNGKAVITDGPFVEAKESIGGFYIIEAGRVSIRCEADASRIDAQAADDAVR